MPATWKLIGDVLDVHGDGPGTELVIGDLERVAKWDHAPASGLVEIDGGHVFSPPNAKQAPGIVKRDDSLGVLIREDNLVRASVAFRPPHVKAAMALEAPSTSLGELTVPSGVLAVAVARAGIVEANRAQIPPKLTKPLQLGLPLLLVPTKTTTFELLGYEPRYHVSGRWTRWELVAKS